jgi:hypothetical protein
VTLEDFTRYFAAGIAFIGAFVVAPHGAALLGRRVSTPLKRVGVHLAKWVPILRRSANVQGLTAASSVGLTSSARLRLRPGWPDRPTVKSLAIATRDWLQKVDGELDDLWNRLDVERSQTEKDVREARATLEASLADLGARVTEAERANAENDSRGIPVLGMGAVLGIIPDRIAELPPWTYWPIVVGVAALTVSAVIGAWRLRHAVA